MRTSGNRSLPWRSGMLALFTLRHTVGIALMLWVTATAYRIPDSKAWMLTAVFALVYLAVVTVSWLRLYRLLRKSRET